MSISNHPVEHEELMAYLDGELAPDRAAEAADHLGQCPECRQLAADLREVSEMLTAWQIETREAETEPELPQQVAERLAGSAPRKPVRYVIQLAGHSFPVRRVMAWGGASAVALLLIIAILVPTLLRSRISANKSARLAENRNASDAYDSFGPGGRNSDGVITTDGPPAQPPKAPPLRGYSNFDKLGGAGTKGALEPAPSATPSAVDDSPDDIQTDGQEKGEDQRKPSNVPSVTGPMIIRTAELQVTTEAFDKARPAVEEILKRHHGYVGQLQVSTPTGSARSLTGTLRVPASELEAALADFKGLGRTENESQGGQEVTAQYVDLEARLANSKHTEQRLVEMLRDRSGRLSDVLEVEMQISRVRGEIEQMEAERKTMKNQVDLATITIEVNEAYKAELNAMPPSTGMQFRNAAIQGYRSLVDGIIAVLLWLLSAGPTLLVWAAILFFPVRYAWRRLKPRLLTKQNL